MDKDIRATVRECIERFDQIESPLISLGTPYVGMNKEVQCIIDIGGAAVPTLCEYLPTATPRVAAYIALCLEHLGDASVIPLLQQTLTESENKRDKGPFDYAFIGSARKAIQKLRA
jgi:hypothetical protein